MLNRETVRRRLAAAVPLSLLPHVGRALDDVSNRPGLAVDSQPIRARRGAAYLQPGSTQQLADAATSLLGVQQPGQDVVVNLFSAAPDATLENFQESFLEAAIGAVACWVARGEPFDERLDDLIRVGASATPAGQAMRALYRGRIITSPRGAPPPADPPKGEWPGLPGIPSRLLITPAGLARFACSNVVRSGLSRWGNAMAAGTPAYVPGATITALQPQDGCAGQTLKVNGTGFGRRIPRVIRIVDAARRGWQRTVVFTGEHGAVTLLGPSYILSWSDTLIEVRIPDGARVGPIGIVDLPPGPSQGVADSFADDLVACFGPAAVNRMRPPLTNLLPTVAEPTAQTDGANLFLMAHPSLTASMFPRRGRCGQARL